MTRALREAARVTRPGGTVLLQVFGRPERCALDVMKNAIVPLLPMAGDGPAYWRTDVLEPIARDSGLELLESFSSSGTTSDAVDREQPLLVLGLDLGDDLDVTLEA